MLLKTAQTFNEQESLYLLQATLRYKNLYTCISLYQKLTRSDRISFASVFLTVHLDLA
jgi:hypothetical protein